MQFTPTENKNGFFHLFITKLLFKKNSLQTKLKKQNKYKANRQTINYNPPP